MKKTIMISLTALLLLSSFCCRGKSDKHGETPPTQAAETVTVMLNDGSELTWIRDTDAPKTNPRSLFPDCPDALWESLGLADGIPASIGAFLLKTGDAYILFDTGLGGQAGRLHTRLAELNIPPAQIKLIYLTHLHPDHIGGLIAADGDADKRMFPDAAVYISRPEYDAWLNDIPNNDLQKRVIATYEDKINLFDFGDTLPYDVMTIDAVGHTPGHTAFRRGQLLIIGDAIHGYALQSEHPQINSIYDADKDKAAQTRQRLLALADSEHLLIAGMHMPEHGTDQR